MREAGEEKVYTDGNRKVSATNLDALRIKSKGEQCTGQQRWLGLRALVGFLEVLVWFPSPTWWLTA